MIPNYFQDVTSLLAQKRVSLNPTKRCTQIVIFEINKTDFNLKARKNAQSLTTSAVVRLALRLQTALIANRTLALRVKLLSTIGRAVPMVRAHIV